MMMMGLIKGLYKQALDKCISSYAEYKLIFILLLLNIDPMTAYFGSSEVGVGVHVGILTRYNAFFQVI